MRTRTPQEKDEDLFQCLEIAHSDNPVHRRAAPFERYMEHCPPLNKCSLYGMMNLIVEGPSLVPSVANKLQVATIGYMYRTNKNPIGTCVSRICMAH